MKTAVVNALVKQGPNVIVNVIWTTQIPIWAKSIMIIGKIIKYFCFCSRGRDWLFFILKGQARVGGAPFGVPTRDEPDWSKTSLRLRPISILAS